MSGALEKAIQVGVSAFASGTVWTRGNAPRYRLAAAGRIHRCHA